MKQKIFYHPQMYETTSRSFSTADNDSGKLIDLLLEMYDPMYFENTPAPLSIDDLYSTHSKGYIDLMLSKYEQYELLPHTLRGGSVVSSILYSFENDTSSLAPTSGFHHARYDRGGTFCLFNSPMIGLNLLVKSYGIKKVGYIDLDAHFSDGTHDIVEKLNLNDSFSIFDFSTLGFAPGQDQSSYIVWLDGFKEKLEAQFINCDFIYLYNGYDAHLKDPLGGYLNDHCIMLRDKIVFSFLNESGIPYSWCLGGAYFEEGHVHKLQLNGIREWLGD